MMTDGHCPIVTVLKQYVKYVGKTLDQKLKFPKKKHTQNVQMKIIKRTKYFRAHIQSQRYKYKNRNYNVYIYIRE